MAAFVRLANVIIQTRQPVCVSVCVICFFLSHLCKVKGECEWKIHTWAYCVYEDTPISVLLYGSFCFLCFYGYQTFETTWFVDAYFMTSERGSIRSNGTVCVLLWMHIQFTHVTCLSTIGGIIKCIGCLWSNQNLVVLIFSLSLCHLLHMIGYVGNYCMSKKVSYL